MSEVLDGAVDASHAVVEGGDFEDLWCRGGLGGDGGMEWNRGGRGGGPDLGDEMGL